MPRDGESGSADAVCGEAMKSTSAMSRLTCDVPSCVESARRAGG